MEKLKTYRVIIERKQNIEERGEVNVRTNLSINELKDKLDLDDLENHIDQNYGQEYFGWDGDYSTPETDDIQILEIDPSPQKCRYVTGLSQEENIYDFILEK